jgi:gamma-glutamyl-gamma-aminobutyrate hydrolase PuuD
MSSEVPVIGVSVGRIPFNGRVIDGTQRDYGDCIVTAGGVPLLLPARPGLPIDEILSHFDGLVFTGGGDVDPERYGAVPAPESGGIDADRDEAEIVLLERAVAIGMPILAVCRGIQVLNVARGGSLVQHLPNVTSEPHLVIDRRSEEVHTVRIDPRSELSRIVGVDELGVNTLHHQAVDRVGAGLKAVAWAEDGTIEALEDDTHQLIAVQWHPEQLPQIFEQVRLFDWLLDRARCSRDH